MTDDDGDGQETDPPPEGRDSASNEESSRFEELLQTVKERREKRDGGNGTNHTETDTPFSATEQTDDRSDTSDLELQSTTSTDTNEGDTHPSGNLQLSATDRDTLERISEEIMCVQGGSLSTEPGATVEALACYKQLQPDEEGLELSRLPVVVSNDSSTT